MTLSPTLRIGVFGRGRLGAAIADRLGDRLAWQVTREAPPASSPADVAIEVSSARTVPARLDWALSCGVPLVIGTTGWDIPDLAERVGKNTGVLTAPNFSLGVALMRRFSLVMARFAARNEACDPYIIEHHHGRKTDAPSGTAKLLASTVLEGCPRKREWRVGGPVDADVLSVGVVRAGHTYSEHRVGLDGPAEVLELRHTARSAATFVDGAIAAAHWLHDKRGVFTMDDVASSVLEPLFFGLNQNSRHDS